MREQIAQSIAAFNIRTTAQDWSEVMEYDLLTADAVLQDLRNAGFVIVLREPPKNVLQVGRSAVEESGGLISQDDLKAAWKAMWIAMLT